MADVLVTVDNASKKFCRSLKKSLWYGMQDMAGEMFGSSNDRELRADEFWAVENVSFELKRGECLGLIGHNGAGKTTLLRMLNGLIKPDKGRIEMRGRVGALIALGAGFNSVLTGRENIYVNASVLGLSKRETELKIDEIIDFAEIGEFIDSPVQNYSSGMQVRLGFAVATALQPDILLLDEVLAVGDAAFRSKCFDRIGKIIDKTAVVFVSHNESQVKRICDHTILLQNGHVLHNGSTSAALDLYCDSAAYQINSRTSCHPAISSPELRILSAIIGWGGDLELELFFSSDEEIETELFLIHVSRGEEFVSCGEVDCNTFRIAVGKNKWGFGIKNLHLAAGEYSAHVSIFSKTRKTTIIHMMHGASFQMDGDRGYGPPYIENTFCFNLGNEPS